MDNNKAGRFSETQCRWTPSSATRSTTWKHCLTWQTAMEV